MRGTEALALALCLAAGAARGQSADDLRVFPAGHKSSDARFALRTLDAEHVWTPPATKEEWAARREMLSAQVRFAAGLLPFPEKRPIAPAIHGRIERDAYTVEKVSFESAPGVYVCGNLYCPIAEATAPRPAILCPHGHWENGRLFERSEADAAKEIERGAERFECGARFPLQARCAMLARIGCVVFFYDMIGVADCNAFGHGEGFDDDGALRAMDSALGLQTWNSIRALDFVAALPGVDAKRIGVTGASGGGTQTFMLCAVDDRIAAAFPAVMVSTKMQGGCPCENAPYLRVDTDNVEIAALMAPKPLGMTGANDWTIDIETKGLPQLRQLYALLGAPENVEAHAHPEFDHNYNQVSREHMYRFFDRHLALGHADADLAEVPFEPIAPADLRVFDAQHPQPPPADSTALRAWWEKRFAGGRAAWLPSTLRALGVASEDVEAKLAGAKDLEHGERVERYVLSRTGRGEEIPAALVLPEREPAAVVIAFATRGKDAFVAAPKTPNVVAPLPDGVGGVTIAKVLAAGKAFLGVDAIGSGEAAGALPIDESRHKDYAGYTFCFRRPLALEQARDALAALRFARTRFPLAAIDVVCDAESAESVAIALAAERSGVRRLWIAPPTLPPAAPPPATDPAFFPGSALLAVDARALPCCVGSAAAFLNG